MTFDDEQRIVQYIRFRDTLSETERQAVQSLIQQDRSARALAEQIRAFQDCYEQESARARADQVDSFVNQLFVDTSASSVVPVTPHSPEPASRPTVLAAATTEAPDDRRISVLTTLTAEEDDLLVRLIGDRKTGQGRLYVLADPPDRQAHVVVSFPDLGLDLVTDENGRLAFDLPSEVTPDQWADVPAVVRSPLGRARLTPGASRRLETEAGATVDCRREDNVLVLEGDAPKRSLLPSLLTVEPAKEHPNRTLLRLRVDAPMRHPLEGDEPYIVRIYE